MEAEINALPDDLSVLETEPEAGNVASTEPAKKFADLDAVFPDDFPDEELRGKPVAKIVDLYKQYDKEIGVSRQKSMQYNDLDSKVRMQERMLEALQRRIEQPAPRPYTPAENVQRFQQAPDRFVDERVDPVRAQLETVRTELYFEKAERVREKARSLGGFDEGAWEENKPAIAALMQAKGLDASDPKNWLEAAKPFAAVLKPRPKVEVPQAGAPPAGQARSQVSQKPAAARFASRRDQENAHDLAIASGFKAGSKAYNELMAELANTGASNE